MSDEGTATVEASLRVGTGFGQDERGPIVDGWASLDARLRPFASGRVEPDFTDTVGASRPDNPARESS
jgi:hypothetical protein